MPQSYTPEFRKKIVLLTKASPLSMAYPKAVFPSGTANLTKNARQKPLKIRMHQMKWN